MGTISKNWGEACIASPMEIGPLNKKALEQFVQDNHIFDVISYDNAVLDYV